MKTQNITCSKPFALVIVFFIIFIVCMVMIVALNSKYVKTVEKFADRQLPLTLLNDYQKSLNCNLDAKFTTFTDNTVYNISDRAAKAEDITTSTTCRSNLSKEKLSSEMAIIEDSRMKYMLKYFCSTILYKQVNINNDIVTVSFNHSSDNDDNIKNMIYLLLSNPLYVEFNESKPYVIMYENKAFTNYNGSLWKVNMDNIYTIKFKNLTPSDNAPPLFNFNKSVQDISNIFKNGARGEGTVKIYYLDAEAAESAGVKLNLDNKYKVSNRVGRINIYNKNFQKDIPNTLDEYYFHQRVFLMLQNSDSPIFTFRFDMVITNEVRKKAIEMGVRSVEIFKVFMDGMGRHTGCSFQTIETNNSNILSCVTEHSSSEDSFFLKILNTNNVNEINSCIIDRNGVLSVELPFSPYNERVTVVVTVSPAGKTVFCKWKVNSKSFFTFKRLARCSKDNTFNRIFKQREKQNTEYVNENINIEYDTRYIPRVAYVQLGHKSYIQDYLE